MEAVPGIQCAVLLLSMGLVLIHSSIAFLDWLAKLLHVPHIRLC